MTDRTVQLAVAGLSALTAANASAERCTGSAARPEVPRERLEDSPFDDYRVPSAVLGVEVGGTAAVAAVAAGLGSEETSRATILAGAISTAWIVAQVGVIGLHSPLQPAMAGVGVTLIGLGRSLA